MCINYYFKLGKYLKMTSTAYTHVDIREVLLRSEGFNASSKCFRSIGPAYVNVTLKIRSAPTLGNLTLNSICKLNNHLNNNLCLAKKYSFINNKAWL